ncbi:MAG: ABC transporter ATP-binding protein [Bacteroidota bacterium]
MPKDIVLRTHNLSKRFKQRWAVNDVNLEVRRGDVFGFLGPNGAGKSTTIRMLLSLIVPTHGEVFLFEKPLRSTRKEVLARVGGLVEAADFYLYLSARKNLEIVAALRGGCTKKEIDAVLEVVGLTDRAHDRVKTYSHGMKQRLGIAQALLGSPEFIILDEPTTGLDPQGIKVVRELIKKLSAEHAMTIFLSSHLLSEIEQTATSMAIINRGKLVVQGKVHELLNDGASVVKIDAQPIERAKSVVQRHPSVETVKENEGMLDVRIPSEHISSLNAMLVEEGIQVKALIPKRSLEDYFLSITENASDIA